MRFLSHEEDFRRACSRKRQKLKGKLKEIEKSTKKWKRRIKELQKQKPPPLLRGMDLCNSLLYVEARLGSRALYLFSSQHSLVQGYRLGCWRSI
jgi:hypothetical protein